VEPLAPTERSLVVGTRIGRYETRTLIGRGGFGLVFAARDVELDRDVALKVLLPEHTFDAQLMQRFFQEARAAAKIEHPAIVTIHDFGRITGTNSPFDGSAYIAMEMVRGEGLAARLQRAGRLSVAHTIAFGRQIASALGAAHRAGIIHRDLKPDNLMLARDPVAPLGERIKVLDFGIAKLAEASLQQQQVRTGHVAFGTPRYMSPEQYRSAGTVDCRTDIYALGCILFELVTGRPPFDGDFVQLLELHTFGERPPMRALAPDAPIWLEALVASMIAPDPAARPSTMDEVEQALASEGGAAEAGARGAPAVAPAAPARGGAAVTANPAVVATTLGSSASGNAVRASPARRKWLAGITVTTAIIAMVAVTMELHGGGRDAALPSSPTVGAVTALSANHQRAEEARARANAFVEQRIYDHAITAYENAYALDPVPETQFELAQALRMAGQLAAAINAYNQYLTTEPRGTKVTAAREQIAELTRLIMLRDSAVTPQPTTTAQKPPAARPITPVKQAKPPLPTPAAHTGSAAEAGSGSAAPHRPCATNDPVCAFGGT
jgi:hypothetical protein